jgi:hypothetical protein
MAKKEVLINVTVQATDGINTLNQVEQSLSRGAKAASDMGSAVNQALQPIKGSVADLQSQVNALERARAATATTSAEYKRQGIEIDRLNVKLGELTGARGLGSVNSAAGIAGATVMEFGRFVSDLPFGIVAVTNNLSQLGSLFSILVADAAKMNNQLSTTKNVLDLLKAQFLGPLGILTLFQVAVAGITLFAQSAGKAEKSVKGLSSTLKDQTTLLRAQLEVYNDGTKTIQERADALRIIESLDKDLAKLLSNSNLSQADRNKLNSDYNRLIDLRIKSEQESEKLAETQILNKAKIAELDAEINRQSKLLVGFTDQQILNDENLFRIQASLIDDQNERNRLQKEYNTAAKEQERLTLELITLEDKFGSSIEAASKKIDALNSATERLIKSRIALISAQEGGSVEEQQGRLEEILELEKQQLKSQEDIDKEKALEAGLSAEELLSITEAYQNEREILEIGHFKALMDIRQDFNKELVLETKTGNDFIVNNTVMSFEDMREQVVGTYSKSETDWRIHHIKISETLRAELERRRKIQENGIKVDENQRLESIANQMMAIQAAQELANGIFDIANAQYDKELILEQNKTVEINNQLKERLRNEQLSADERKSIQNQIAQNDEALRKKQEAIEEKRFKLNKAASLANAVVNTYLAATGVLAETNGNVFARIAGMVAVIGAGLAQVAVIAKQRFIKSDAGGAPGISASSASAPTAVQAPAFNVVGQSNASQLADVVRGQLDRPVKTYVVASEVTTAQALERNRVSAASI